MIHAYEARQIIANKDLSKWVGDALEELDRLIQLKAADGGNQLVYEFKDRRLVEPVGEALIEHGFTVNGGFPSITINW